MRKRKCCWRFGHSSATRYCQKSGYPDVDFAFTNNGGIRADLVVKPDGTVTWGAAQAVQPFGNILQVVEITGDQIYKALDQQYDEKELYFLQMAGIKYTYTKPADATEENPYKVVKAYKADGTEIDRNKTYKAIINDFLYGGGDGFSVFRDTKLIGAINPDTEVFIQYIEDVNKAGKKLSASILGNKTFVEKWKKKHLLQNHNQPLNQLQNQLHNHSQRQLIQ